MDEVKDLKKAENDKNNLLKLKKKNFKKMTVNKNSISVIGLGYVGLPLAIELGKKFKVKGFDISKARLLNLKKKKGFVREIKTSEFKKSKFLSLQTINKTYSIPIYILAVPTPLKKIIHQISPQ